MKKLYAIISISIFLSQLSFSQTAPGIEWQNTIGGSGFEADPIIKPEPDGGYILAGSSTSNISGDKTENNVGSGAYDYWIIELDVTGSIEWQNTIGGLKDDYLSSFDQTSDGGYILGGSSTSGIGGDKTQAAIAFSSGNEDYWIVKLDAAGNVEWDKVFGGKLKDILTSVEQTSDGGYIVGGYSESGIYITGNKSENSLGLDDYWILKLDASGNIQWQNTIGGSGSELLNTVTQTTDGGYILCGGSTSGISGDKTEVSRGNYDYWIVKLDDSGNLEWQKTLGGDKLDIANGGLQQTSDGGYILGGYTLSGISGDKTEPLLDAYPDRCDMWVIKLDMTGELEWQNTIGGDNFDYAMSIRQNAGGNYILASTSSSAISGDKTEGFTEGSGFALYDYWLLELNGTGEIIWQNTIGGDLEDLSNAMEQTADGGYIVAGYSYSSASGDKSENSISIGTDDFWILKLFPEEIPACSTAPEDLFADHITTTKAKLHWDADAGAIKYKVQYRPATSGAWITVNSTGNVKTLTGLSPNTLYKYRVRSTCTDVLSSTWSGIQTFTTLPLREGVNGEPVALSIYPNPNNGIFTIQFFEINEAAIFISIKNMMGDEMYAEQINLPELNHTVSVNKDIPAGIYVVEIKTNDNIFSQQIILTQ